MFSQASAVRPLREGLFGVEVDPSWFQGKGTFGGLVAAWLLRAAIEADGDLLRAPRELTCHFCAPARAGKARLRAQVARRGLSASYVTVRMEQREKVIALATATLGKPRATDQDYTSLQMPSAPAALEAPRWDIGEQMPAFTQHFDLRTCLGGAPLTGAADAVSGGWVRLRAPEPVDAPAVAALLDCWPPAFFTRLQTEARPAGTTSISYAFHRDLPAINADPADYHLLEVSSHLMREGYAVEDERLWSVDGRLVAEARQIVALIA
jgi:acyl-CoA thioesterase